MYHNTHYSNISWNKNTYSFVLFYQATMKSIVGQHMPKKKEKKGSYSWFSSWRSNPKPITTTTAPSSTRVTTTTSEPDILEHKELSSMVGDINTCLLRPKKNILCFGQPNPTYLNWPTQDFFLRFFFRWGLYN